jgi:hypothetical protein
MNFCDNFGKVTDSVKELEEKILPNQRCDGNSGFQVASELMSIDTDFLWQDHLAYEIIYEKSHHKP